MDNPEHPLAEPTLMQRAQKGVVWVGAVTIGTKILSVTTTLILTRFLAPADFGLIAIAGVAVSALAIFTDLGLGAAIIHSKANRQRMASTAFFIMPVIGLVLYLIAFFGAPMLAGLLGNPSASTIIRIVAVNILISSFVVVPSILMEKDMAYRRKAIPDLVPTLIYIPTVLVLASVFHLGAYSIAFGLIVQALTNLALNWFMAKWRPSLVFDLHIARDLALYGKNVLGGSLIAYLTTNTDNALVSRALGAASLGYYTLAYSITNIPATHIADVFGRVLFPSFVELNHDPVRLKRAYVRALSVLAIVAFPVLFGLAAIAGPFVEVIMGERWAAIVPVMQALVIFVVLRVVSGPTGSLFLATNNSKIILTTGITGLILQVGALFSALAIVHSGIVGAAWAIGIAATLNSIFILRYLRRIIPFSPKQTFGPALRLVLPSVVMGAIVYGLTLSLPVSLKTLFFEVTAGAIIYAATLMALNGRSIIADTLKLLKPSSP